MSSESDISKACVSLLKYRGCLVLRLNAGTWQNARTGSWIVGVPNGTPDYAVAIPKNDTFLFGFLETKSSVGTLNDNQIAFLRSLNKNVPWVVVNDSKQVDKWLSDLSYHGEDRLIKDVIDPSKKFVPIYTGKRKTRNTKMTASIMHQYDVFNDGAKVQKEIDINDVPF